MKRVEPSFKGSVSVTGAAAATLLACGRVCAGAAGAKQTSTPTVNNEARMRLIAFSTLIPRLRKGVGHEIDDEPVLSIHQEQVAPDVAVPNLLGQLRQAEQQRGRHLQLLLRVRVRVVDAQRDGLDL